MTAEFWNPATEAMPRQELGRWKWHKLQRALAQARGSKFWSSRIPEDISSLGDYVRRVEPVFKKDLVEAEALSPPYGILPSVDPAVGGRYFQTSGTSGNTPLRTLDTTRDWIWGVDMWCTALYGAGIREGHSGCVAFGYGMFAGFWGMQDAMLRLGCTIVPTGSMDSQARVELLVDKQLEVLGSTPTYAMRLLDKAREMGVDLARDGNVKYVVTAAEPRPPSTTRALAEGYGAQLVDVAGMSELGTVFMFECPTKRGNCHIIESDFIEEVVDPNTGKPVGYGELGVRVTTGLGREGLQLFRYWTEDMVVKQPFQSCTCGRTWDYYEGGIRGRHDDMRKIRGIAVTPALIEDVVRAFDEVTEFQSVLRTVRGLDTVVLQIEPRAGVAVARDRGLDTRIAGAMKRKIGLQPDIELVSPETLPRFEAKARRFHDERQH